MAWAHRSPPPSATIARLDRGPVRSAVLVEGEPQFITRCSREWNQWNGNPPTNGDHLTKSPKSAVENFPVPAGRATASPTYPGPSVGGGGTGPAVVNGYGMFSSSERHTDAETRTYAQRIFQFRRTRVLNECYLALRDSDSLMANQPVTSRYYIFLRSGAEVFCHFII